ncbi:MULTISPECIES: hypothetical protein [Acetobacteraceae]|uniref:Uncharacterized protein n=2 Tax=Acetobacteraceae TaxID=433 RepID=A0A850NYK9_9PROT|nr:MULTISPECIES: hypothetical protein [Acetobacteraceae]ASL40377.1 hypothetical protein CBI36_07935 [Acetobacter oryzifermentans]KAA8425735.1 hypothetical protein FKW54_08455 [Acetobacter pomorum]KAA8435829.1 hypothetical protein FKW50_06060 [Acetobacter pomorum]KAA8446134.1 hypothetical protein FKW52_14765 [Acetobacter pomorum]MCG0996261.1 hypothetical protein [Acetobacter indonesiensis]
MTRAQTRGLNIAIDRIPDLLYQEARDWTDLALTRLLTIPLFSESQDRGVNPVAARHLARVGDTAWILSLDASHDPGLTAEAFCGQIVRAAQGSGSARVAANLVDSISYLSRDEVRINTRLPIAHLDRILLHPGLCVASSDVEVCLGEDSPGQADLFFRRISDQRELSFTAPAPCVAESNYEDSVIDVLGPMATEAKDWEEGLGAAGVADFALDMLYAMIFPDELSRSARQAIASRLSRLAETSMLPGFVLPCWRLNSLWTDDVPKIPEAPHGTIGFRECIVEFSDFPGNRETAIAVVNALKSELNVTAHLRKVDYAALCSSLARLDQIPVFKLGIIASPWAHPASILTAIASSHRGKSEVRESVVIALACDRMSSAIYAANDAEKALDANPPFVIVGKITGRFRSRYKLPWIPPSGWLDYFSIQK